MASLTYKDGKATIQVDGPDGKRHSIRLGNCNKRQAISAKMNIENLLSSRNTGGELKQSTSEWVGCLPYIIRRRIERAGLIGPREGGNCPTVEQWFKNYIAGRMDAKPATIIKFGQIQKKVADFFGCNKRLNEVNAGDAEDFRNHLKNGGLSEGSTRRLCGLAKQVFGKSLKKKMIGENPFADIRCANIADSTRFFFVTKEAAQAVFDACPDNEWRLIFALCRYGALRCPSEVLRLTWGDIDWENNKFTVHACKTEHHEGGGIRIVPIFPELLPYLRDCFEQADPGSEYCINRYRNPGQNLRTQFERIILKAGLTPWEKLFVNLRSTRVTELNETFPSHVVAAWAGHSEAVEKKHYLQVTEDHFKKAVQNPVQNDTASGCIGPQANRDNEAEMAFCGVDLNSADPCEGLKTGILGVIGLEPMTSSTSRKRSSQLS